MVNDLQTSWFSLVLLSLYSSGRDENHFPDPEKVIPERWIRNNESGELDLVYKAHGTLPFALGGRSCIGRKIAVSETPPAAFLQFQVLQRHLWVDIAHPVKKSINQFKFLSEREKLFGVKSFMRKPLWFLCNINSSS
uniref:Cholesterol side-chain cleavage enzyme, mitochondrial n=1 Tax=Megaselia scalaris TaxID=36166 RepID=T1GE44_MEGSC